MSLPSSKTPASILQELMIKRNELPYFELVGNDGPPHQMKFTYRVTAAGVTVEATARSKKDAKQDAAKLCLEELAELGIYKPEQTSKAAQMAQASPAKPRLTAENAEYGANSPAVMLLELCAEFSLGEPVYTLISDKGPPHAREFEMSVMVGQSVRSGISSTKKAARQIAAQQLYNFLKGNLEPVIKEYSEDALVDTASKKASAKYAELKENMPWRPNLGQKVAEYHLGLRQYIDEEALSSAVECLDLDVEDPIEKVEETLNTLGLEFEWTKLTAWDNSSFHVLHVPKSWPALAWSGAGDRRAVALQALTTLHHLLPVKGMLMQK